MYSTMIEFQKTDVHRGQWRSLLTGFVFLLMFGLGFASIQEDLVAYYPLDGNVNDESGHARDGVYLNGTWTFEDGAIDQALKLPGTPDSRIEFSPWVPGASSFSVAGWFKIDDVSELWMGNIAAIITEQAGDFSHGFTFRIRPEQEGVYELQFVICANYGTSTWARYSGCSTDELFGQWHHAAAVVDRQNMVIQLYYDGDLVDSFGLNTGAIYPTKGLIGSYDYLYPRNGATRYVSPANRLDDIRIYNRSLSDSEVQDLFNQGISQVPVADAGPDQEVSAGSDCLASVTLDGSGSSNPDGDELQYLWTGPFGELDSPVGSVSLPIGTHEITLTVTDSHFHSATDTLWVTVIDQTPPEILSISASPKTLWPPNHKMVTVSVSADITDSCDGGVPYQIISVTSNEPVNGQGDGDTSPDWIITGDHTVLLRAERSGNGNGRIYTITVETKTQLEIARKQQPPCVFPRADDFIANEIIDPTEKGAFGLLFLLQLPPEQPVAIFIASPNRISPAPLVRPISINRNI